MSWFLHPRGRKSKQRPSGEHPDLVIARVAENQHGVVGRRQLLDRGVSDRQIRHRLAIRRLRVMHAGVYTVAVTRVSLQGQYFAAAFACGSDALISHRCAAALWDLRGPPSGPIDITVPRGGRRPSRPGIAIHTSGLPPSDSRSVVEGLPCTSLARTLFDLAAAEPTGSLRRLVNQAQLIGIVDRGAIDALITMMPRRAGVARLKLVLAEVGDSPQILNRELERRFAELSRRSGLPPPVTNAIVCGYPVDFHWPQQRVVLETDGRATHTSRATFDSDRQRDLDLQMAGWRVVRIGWRQLHDRPEQIVTLLRAYLE